MSGIAGSLVVWAKESKLKIEPLVASLLLVVRPGAPSSSVSGLIEPPNTLINDGRPGDVAHVRRVCRTWPEAQAAAKNWPSRLQVTQQISCIKRSELRKHLQ